MVMPVHRAGCNAGNKVAVVVVIAAMVASKTVSILSRVDVLLCRLAAERTAAILFSNSKNNTSNTNL